MRFNWTKPNLLFGRCCGRMLWLLLRLSEPMLTRQSKCSRTNPTTATATVKRRKRGQFSVCVSRNNQLGIGPEQEEEKRRWIKASLRLPAQPEMLLRSCSNDEKSYRKRKRKREQPFWKQFGKKGCSLFFVALHTKRRKRRQ